MGEVVVSVDAELSWGYHDLDDVPARIDRAREGWRTATALFDRYDVPATWAIVGHLLLDSCDGRHEDHPRGPEWFPCTAGPATGDDDWRAPDLVEALLASGPDHEVGTHTFSHVLMDGTASRRTATAEFALSRDAADAYGLDLESVVFPRNLVGHRDVLADQGYTCYRGVRPRAWYESSTLRPLLKLADWSQFGKQPPLVTPSVDAYGLVNVPASLYLYSFEGPMREVLTRVTDDPVVAVARRGIEKAVAGDGVFHMWLHPHNLLQPGGTDRLDAVLAYLSRRRAETDLSVRTMGEIARERRDDEAGLSERA